MFSPEERQRAAELYFTTPMTWDIRLGSVWNAGRQSIPGMPAVQPDPSSTRDKCVSASWRPQYGHYFSAA